MIDFVVQTVGTLWRFVPVSDRAEAFATDDLGLEPWQRLGKSFAVDWRPAKELVIQLKSDGFRIRME